MSDLTSRVIRSDEVKIAGRRQIGCASAAKAETQSEPAARIVSEDAAGATIEVVCECGRRTFVRCAYRGAEARVQEAAK